MISFYCTECGLKFEVKPEFAGRSSLCPTCKNPLVVPSPASSRTEIAVGQLDGAHSSLAEVGLDGGITLESASRTRTNSIDRLLAQRTRKDGRYVIEGELVRGGMGIVLRAVDCDIRREVAVKYLLDQTDSLKKARFIDEAQITGQLEHPNIVPIHELSVDAQKRLFFSMKMVKGRSLAEVLDALRNDPKASQEYSLGRLLNVFVSVCNALAYAHSRGVVHRDLKPANIMLGDFGEVYVMDWGLAKVLTATDAPVNVSAPMATLLAAPVPGAVVAIPASDSRTGLNTPTNAVMTNRSPEADLTQEGVVLGTPVYMPPEQATGNMRAIDQRSDVYSLGAILYEMLALQPPVDKEGGYLAILMRVMEGEIVPPEKRPRGGRAPRELSAIAMKALARKSEDRYPNVEALRQDIERFQEGRSVSAKDDTMREAMWKLVKRNRGVSLTVALASIVLIAVLGFSFQAIFRAYSNLQQAQTVRQLQGKKSAPLFFQDAKASASRKEVDYALAQVSVALEYDPDIAEARMLKAQLLIVNRDFVGAKRELADYVRRRADDRDAAELMVLCDKARPQDASSSVPFVEVLVRQKAFGLAEQMELDRDRLLVLYRKQIDAAWPPFGARLRTDKDGKCTLDISDGGAVVKDLTPLEGIPFSHLDLSNCSQVRDLTPLKNMPLVSLDLRNMPQLRDLAPLEGMKLTSLSLVGGQMSDLTPLKGMPLNSLILHGCTQVSDLSVLPSLLSLSYLDLGFCPQVKDLSPLKKTQITRLSLYGSPQLRDLGPLKGMQLVWLNLQNCNQISDLRPLQGMPLAGISLLNCPQVKDLRPLMGMDLTDITINPKTNASAIETLRTFKSLKTIRVGPGSKEAYKPEDFWRKWDAGEFSS